MALVEDEAKFPHERQNTVDRYQHHEQLFRVICTTVVIIAGFVAAGTLAYFEAYTAASIAVGATLVGLASAFVGNASKSQKERGSVRISVSGENSYLRERCSQTREHPRFLFT